MSTRSNESPMLPLILPLLMSDFRGWKEFLPFFDEWQRSAKNRIGNYTPKARSKMFISWQTYESLQITSFAAIEAIKFLLSEGVDYVLTERFCQDPVEEFFGN